MGSFVIRADRHGVPTMGMLTNASLDATRRIVRLLRHDKTWVIRVRLASNDPFGPDTYSQIVADQSEVPLAIARLSALVRSGDDLAEERSADR